MGDTINMSFSIIGTMSGKKVLADAKTYADSVAAAQLIYDGSTVLFNDTHAAINTFEDHDASGTVGSNRAMLILKITANNQCEVSTRMKGETATLIDHDKGGIGNVCEITAADRIGFAIVFTDANGVFQSASSNNLRTVTITLVAYMVTG